MNAFWELDIESEVPESKLIQILAAFLQLPLQKIISKEEFWKQVIESPNKWLASCSVTYFKEGNFHARFDTIINSQDELTDEDRLRFACKIASEIKTRVLTGDYTSRCEFLLVDSDCKVYSTDSSENKDGSLSLHRVISEGKAIDHFIAAESSTIETRDVKL